MILLHWIPLSVVLLMKRLGRYTEINVWDALPGGVLAAGRSSEVGEILVLALPITEWGYLFDRDCCGWLRLHMVWTARYGFELEWLAK